MGLFQLVLTALALACSGGFAVATGGSCVGGVPDGIVESQEQCDDGNAIGSDDCTSACTVATCGDGVLHTLGVLPLEQCDAGEANSDQRADACRKNCMTARCGDAVLDRGEECDDGNTLNNDQCRADCVRASCGDGVLCSLPGCHSGPGGGPELCDDGNAVGSDDCTSACAPNTCGDGIPHTKGTPPFDTCDDGNTSDHDSCPGNCLTARCGDGFVCSEPGCGSGPEGGAEACDDGNQIDHDGCRNNCTASICGDGVLRTLGEGPFEECDTGPRNSDDRPEACRTDCRTARCGDGVTDSGLGEQCDPGESPGALAEADAIPCSPACCYAAPVESAGEALAGARCELRRLVTDLSLQQCAEAGTDVRETSAELVALLVSDPQDPQARHREIRRHVDQLRGLAIEGCESVGGYTARDAILSVVGRVRILLGESGDEPAAVENFGRVGP